MFSELTDAINKAEISDKADAAMRAAQQERAAISRLVEEETPNAVTADVNGVLYGVEVVTVDEGDALQMAMLEDKTIEPMRKPALSPASIETMGEGFMAVLPEPPISFAMVPLGDNLYQITVETPKGEGGASTTTQTLEVALSPAMMETFVSTGKIQAETFLAALNDAGVDMGAFGATNPDAPFDADTWTVNFRRGLKILPEESDALSSALRKKPDALSAALSDDDPLGAALGESADKPDALSAALLEGTKASEDDESDDLILRLAASRETLAEEGELITDAIEATDAETELIVKEGEAARAIADALKAARTN